jgi:hypothetical protein
MCGTRCTNGKVYAYKQQDLHNATSQKTTFFIVTAVKTSNRTNNILVGKTICYMGDLWIGLRVKIILKCRYGMCRT